MPSLTQKQQNRPLFGRAPELWPDEQNGSATGIAPQELHGLGGFYPGSRREFLKLMGASLALAGWSGCTRQPLEKIVPYVRQPEEVVPGEPLFYATSFQQDGYAEGVLVESNLGRPTKIEGNPLHPASFGATSRFAQASILDLYDPTRAKTPLFKNRTATWDEFRKFFQEQSAEGKELALLFRPSTSPTLQSQLKAFSAAHPQTNIYLYDPCGLDGGGAAKPLLAQQSSVRYDFSKANIILSLFGDFLSELPGSLAYARQTMSNRRAGAQIFNRIYSIESVPGLVGTIADHRFACKESLAGNIVRFLASELGLPGTVSSPQLDSRMSHLLRVAAADLKANRGRSVIYPGKTMDSRLRRICQQMNQYLENTGSVVVSQKNPEDIYPEQTGTLQELVEKLERGAIAGLLIFGGNPAFDKPGDLPLDRAFSKAQWTAHLTEFSNETSALCTWSLPKSHYLESWGDARAYDGTASLIQPLIAPLHESRTDCELLEILTSASPRSSYELTKALWQKNGLSEEAWEHALHQGFVPDTTFSHDQQHLAAESADLWNGLTQEESTGIEVYLRPDPTIGDGSWSHNAWLQELPKPLTEITWENAVYLSSNLAAHLNLRNEDLVRLVTESGAIRLPVWILPNQAPGTASLHFGYGRRGPGDDKEIVGENVYPIRTTKTPWRLTNVSLEKVSGKYPLAARQLHQNMEKRDLVRTASFAELAGNETNDDDHQRAQEYSSSLYPPYRYDSYAWGMTIDLTACIGCKACVVACQAENNIPTVGKKEVRRGHFMHWLRIDQYYSGSPANPLVFHQPVLCMHCENAPCELVCPVGATTHSSEGLNEMTYNRCVGTRYCSNNCPYKVRRFNFFQYSDRKTPLLQLLYNPDVTVRMRGVMEKCTYCVQRINRARIKAKEENRPIADGEIRTACQAVCPAQAIVFGNINDEYSQVSRWKRSVLNYGLLTELNTVPRTTYLARLSNPNPALEGRS